MSAIYFFAVDQDLHPVLSCLEAREGLSYTRVGLFPTPTPQTFATWTQLPNLSIATASQISGCHTYLLSSPGVDIVATPIPQRAGGLLYAIDQLMNPSTITLTAGGRFVEDIVIAGRFATCTDHECSHRFMRILRYAVQKYFRQINGVCVGDSAWVEFQAGKRLTHSRDSPVLYDLREC